MTVIKLGGRMKSADDALTDVEKPAEDSGMVSNIMRYSVEDGPGLRTTVFLKGCPLSCRWCHNPENQFSGRELVFREVRCIKCGECVSVCPQGAVTMSDGGRGFPRIDDSCDLCGACVESCASEALELIGRRMTVSEVMAEISRDIAFYEESGGGITISGGEPLAQPEFLDALLKACSSAEIHTAVDTCGYAPWELFDRIRPFVNLFLYDLKLMDDYAHKRETGVSNRQILLNLRRLAESGEHVLVRMPIIPGINDHEAEIEAVGTFLSSLPGIREIQILPYHESGWDKYKLLNRRYNMPATKPPEDVLMDDIAAALEEFGLLVSRGGSLQ